MAFLLQIRKHYPYARLIHLFVDGAPYNKAEQVHVLAKKLNIKIHFLPPHSPNLNPIERLWKVMNKNVRNNQFFDSAKMFKKTIDLFFKETLPNIADDLQNTINDNFQKLNSVR